MMILVWESKHGNVYYDASTDELLDWAAKQILAQWLDYYIVKPDDPMKHIQYSGIDLEQANLSTEQIAALPTESMRAEAAKHKNNLARRYAQYENDLQVYADVQTILSGESVTRERARRSGLQQTIVYDAWHILQEHADGEYMNVEFLRVKSPS